MDGDRHGSHDEPFEIESTQQTFGTLANASFPGSNGSDELEDSLELDALFHSPKVQSTLLLHHEEEMEKNMGRLHDRTVISVSPCVVSKKRDKISPRSLPYVLNAVHMEVQENAKIPNTYNVPIVRRNPDYGSNFMEEIMKLSEEDLILTEKFLGSEYRSSKTAAYSNAGALLSSIGSKVESMSSASLQSKPLSVNTLGDDHVLDESEENTKTSYHRNQNEVEEAMKSYGPHDPHQSVQQKLNQGTESSCQNTRDGIHHKQPAVTPSTNGTKPNVPSVLPSLHYAYGRSIPLPIPTKLETTPLRSASRGGGADSAQSSSSVSSSSSSLQKDTESSQSEKSKESSKTSNHQIIVRSGTTSIDRVGPSPSLPLMVSTVSQPNKNYLSSNTKSTNILQPTMTNAPALAPCILEATKKRSQFGFGGNHTVPSVPLPPKVTLEKKTQNDISSRKKSVPAIPSKSPATEGASYERKKQRAKDARIKLNESIERLSLAMNVAGTQSKERIKVEKGWSKLPKVKFHSAEANCSSILSIMEQVSKTAEDAKKWDRPSFVGTAALMVQSLNAECEGLMRELVKLRKEKLQWMDSSTKSCVCGKRKIDQLVDSNNVSDSGSFDNNDDDSDDNSRKKRKDLMMESDVTIECVFQHDSLVLRIGGFLDPCSIIRTTSVSSSWQFRLSCLRSDAIWSDLCYKRFGSARVREWHYLKMDEDSLGWNECINHSLERNFMLDLYKDMNSLNLKPKCHFEGDLYLGGGMMNNAVSAWASLVDRSNGETKRSVLTVGNAGEAKYVSLPVVELRILVQNIGISDGAISIPDQIISIDASTKRSRGAEMFEITSDDRFKKRLINLDGTTRDSSATNSTGVKILTELGLFESTIICAFINTTSCPTTQKVKAKAKFVKVLLNVRGTTVPLVIPFDT